MKIYPAIDLHKGKCVRLFKGDINTKVVYNSKPINQAQIFEDHGFKNLHVVDLDAALDGNSENKKIIAHLKKKTKLKIQLGGGIRNFMDVKNWFDCGIDKIIIGTMFFKNRHDFERILKDYPNKVLFALDVKGKKIAIKGWKHFINLNLKETLKELNKYKLSSIIYTDINRDGTGLGPDVYKIQEIKKKIKSNIIVSGGISSIQDIKILQKTIKVEGVIVGKAIYDSSINLLQLSKLQS